MSAVDTAILVLTNQALLVLGLHSIYKTIEKEADQARIETSQSLKAPRVAIERFRSLLGERDIATAALIVSILAGVSWAIYTTVLFDQIVQVWAFSLALIEGLVLFFVIETFYLLSSRWLAPSLRNNRLFVRAVDGAALSGALLVSLTSTIGCMFGPGLSCAVQSLFNYLSIGIFFLIFFVSGLGAIAIVDTISDSLSSHLPLGRKKHSLSLTGLFGAMIGLTIILSGGSQVLGDGSVWALVGAELGLVVGIIYMGYLLVRRRESERSSSLVYTILMLGLAGLFTAYSLRSLAPNIGPSGIPVGGGSLAGLVLSLTLFSVGYVSIVFHMPRSVERRLGVKQSRLVTTVTFLMIFVVVANYQLAVFSGLGTSIFFFQKETSGMLGLWGGALLLTVKKLKQANESGKLHGDLIIPFCATCGLHISPISKFCPNCGSIITRGPENVSFVSHAQMVADTGEHHSLRRKVGSAIAGGPMGYLTFGMDLPLKRVSEGQVAVTNKAVYFGGNAYPLNHIVGVKPGHYSNSVILTMKQFVPKTTHTMPVAKESSPPLFHMELKTSNVKAFARTIERSALVNA